MDISGLVWHIFPLNLNVLCLVYTHILPDYGCFRSSLAHIFPDYGCFRASLAHILPDYGCFRSSLAHILPDFGCFRSSLAHILPDYGCFRSSLAHILPDYGCLILSPANIWRKDPVLFQVNSFIHLVNLSFNSPFILLLILLSFYISIIF